MLNGFVGEFLVLSSTFTGVSRGWAIAATVTVILGASYMLWLVQRLFYGPESSMAERAVRRMICGFTRWPWLCPAGGLDAGDGRGRPTTGCARSSGVSTRVCAIHEVQTTGTQSSARGYSRLHHRGGPPMNAQDSLRILPEIILTITGILVMLIDASLPRRLGAPAVGLGRGPGHDGGALGQPLATEPGHGNGFLRHG